MDGCTTSYLLARPGQSCVCDALILDGPRFACKDPFNESMKASSFGMVECAFEYAN